MFVYPKYVIPQMNALQVYFIKFCENTRRVKEELHMFLLFLKGFQNFSFSQSHFLKNFGKKSEGNILKIGIVPE